MDEMLLVGVLVLLVLGGIGVLIMHNAPEVEDPAQLCVFAVLPVTDATPRTEALLRYYAAQTAWMDAEVLRCVLLVYPPEDAETEALCRDMAREYSTFRAVPLPEAQALMAEKCRQNSAPS
ncbi:MAG: hypothetical protein K5695_16230 [Oscillospiraceae bacterium]|nr:hypothetical protein [Oscillospiraceae bacterium]